jgi:hypothetical protein
MKLLNSGRTPTGPADVTARALLHTLPFHDQTTEPIKHEYHLRRAPFMARQSVRAGELEPSHSVPVVVAAPLPRDALGN